MFTIIIPIENGVVSKKRIRARRYRVFNLLIINFILCDSVLCVQNSFILTQSPVKKRIKERWLALFPKRANPC